MCPMIEQHPRGHTEIIVAPHFQCVELLIDGLYRTMWSLRQPTSFLHKRLASKAACSG